jgi:hypothetical protein
VHSSHFILIRLLSAIKIPLLIVLLPYASARLDSDLAPLQPRSSRCWRKHRCWLAAHRITSIRCNFGKRLTHVAKPLNQLPRIPSLYCEQVAPMRSWHEALAK